MTTHFFLGANSGSGFQSLYDGFVDPLQNRDVMVLKGGPGVGKSTFMKELGRRAEAAGEAVEYIWCSGDPDSLDGLRLPRLGIVAVDGTAPHVVEPRYPAAADRYVNLGAFYQVEGCKEIREGIILYTGEYQEHYHRAYHALKAAAEVGETLRSLRAGNWDRERLLRRAEGVIRRELPRKGGGGGTVSRRFLGGPTCQGMVQRFDTVENLADRVYVLLDSWGLGDLFLRRLEQAAAERGVDVILCPDPEDPRRRLHLLLPELGLAFVTSRPGMEYPGTAFRRFHLDALLDQETERTAKARCRFLRRMRSVLLEEGVEQLKEAKRFHDLLEAEYHPWVDFAGVNGLIDREWERIRKAL